MGGCRAAIFHNQQLDRPQLANCYWTWTVDTLPGPHNTRPSGDLAWTLPGHPARGLMKLTSFLDAADDGVIGQVRLLSPTFIKLSTINKWPVSGYCCGYDTVAMVTATSQNAGKSSQWMEEACYSFTPV